MYIIQYYQSTPTARFEMLCHAVTQTPSAGLRHPSFGGRCRKAVLGVCCGCCCKLTYISKVTQSQCGGGGGGGIAQWLERRTRDWKVAGSNPCWNSGRIFFSRVDFLCWLLFRYPFHPRVTTVARKKSRSFCQKCRWQVTAKHAYTLRMWLLLNRASALVTTCP